MIDVEDLKARVLASQEEWWGTDEGSPEETQAAVQMMHLMDELLGLVKALTA